MANNSKSNKKRPAGQKGRPAATSSAGSGSSASEGASGSGSASGSGASAAGGSSSASTGGAAATTTTTVRDVEWQRRKTWPLLLGSAAALTGLGVANYSWANPDGRLTSKAQDALTAKFPGAEVRVHGRDAIITGLPAGADIDVAHDLVRKVEGVRNVKEDLAAAAPDSAPADTSAAETVVAAPDSVATETVAADTLASETSAAETVAAPAVAAETAPADTTPASDVPATDAPTTVAPTTAAPTTTIAEAPPTSVAAPAEAAPAGAADAPPVKIHFDTVSSEIVGDSTASVDQLIAYLEANPDVRIKVVGHADNIGTRLTNMAISRARADSVVSSLVAAGIDRSRISAFAQGDRLPVESNATAEGRRANRRVDIVFYGAEGSGGREVAFTG